MCGKVDTAGWDHIGVGSFDMVSHLAFVVSSQGVTWE